VHCFFRNVLGAQETYLRSVGNGACGEIDTLAGLTLVEPTLAKGESYGYRFYKVDLPQGGCEVHAVPVSDGSDANSYFYSTVDKVHRLAKKNGDPASASDAAFK
jgi:hypothetical protein